MSLVRLSGSRAIAIADSLFRGKKPLAACESHTAHFGSIYKGEKLIDEVVATLFRAPKSYTGDDTVELTCHGSAYIVGEVLRLAIGAGARMAEPGEFTRRAYLSGRLNLSEAEAVADLIASSSEAAHRLATQQMRGGYTTAIEHLRNELLQLTTLLELELDFSEEDVEFADRGRLAATMEAIGAEIETLRGSFALGNAIKEGVPVAIVGAPNVGKSTLLNQLVKEERAMVSDIAGTTRDVIEEQIVIDGVRFRILDTAGIRSTEDRLEKMGIERTLRTIERARIVIRMIDAAEVAQKGIEPATFTLREDQHLITLINKCDTVTALPTLPEGVIRLTARTGEGVESLQRALHRAVGLETLEEGSTIVSTARHYEALTTASESLKRALEGLQADLPADLLSEDIRAVITAIGSITARGEILPSEILNNLFGHFCIGK